jgi:hypothetical protein
MVVAILRCSGSLLDEILGWFACWLTTPRQHILTRAL